MTEGMYHCAAAAATRQIALGVLYSSINTLVTRGADMGWHSTISLSVKFDRSVAWRQPVNSNYVSCSWLIPLTLDLCLAQLF